MTDSRTEATDESGPLARRLLEAAGHEIARHALLPNDEARVRTLVSEWLASGDLSAIVITGGTGLGSKDRTVEAVTPLFEKEIPGFGELFRLLSYQEQIGTTAILSRAVAGCAKGAVVVSLPGSKAPWSSRSRAFSCPNFRTCSAKSGASDPDTRPVG